MKTEYTLINTKKFELEAYSSYPYCFNVGASIESEIGIVTDLHLGFAHVRFIYMRGKDLAFVEQLKDDIDEMEDEIIE